MNSLFRYRALDQAGQLVSGRLEAEDSAQLQLQLRRHGLDLLSVRKVRLSPQGLPRQRLADFCFQLEQMLSAGIPLLEAVDDLAGNASGRRLRAICRRIGNELRSGKAFSSALPMEITHREPAFAGMIQAGELSGNLAETLARLGNSLRQAERMQNATRQLLTYPAIAALMVGAAFLFLLLHLVPQIRTFLGDNAIALPWHTRLLFFVSDLVRQQWLTLIALIVAPPLTLALLLRIWPDARQRLDRLRLSLPVLGPILRKLAIARIAELLAMLYTCGVPLLAALESLPAAITNHALRAALYGVRHQVEQGATLSQAFGAQALFPRRLIRMLETGERTGRLDATLNSIASAYEQEAGTAIARLQGMLQPATTLAIGILLGWMMLATMQPLYGIIGRAAP